MAQQGTRRRRRRRRRRNNGAQTALVAFVAVIALAAAGFIGFGMYVSSKDVIYPNVKVAGIDVGGMSYDTAHSTLLNASVGVPSGVKATALLTSDVQVSVTSDEAGLVASITDAVDAAYAYGKDGNLFKKTMNYLKCLSRPKDVYSESVFNDSGVKAAIAEAADRADHGPADSSYTVTDTDLRVVKGSSGYTVDQQGVLDFIRNTLMSGVSGTTDEFSEAKRSGQAGSDPDFDAIYDQVYREAIDARYDTETQTVTESQVGVSFDKSQAQSLYDQAAPGAVVTVPLIITQPQVTQDQLTGALFRDRLAAKDTSLKGSNSNRINNVTLAAAACNDLVLQPGDEFSFNGTTGQRTKEKGYKEAGAYAGGTTVQEVGGGICQVSSTIYYCTLLADLQITKRTNHAFTVSYLPIGFDATVNWPNLDFKFKNDKNYPIKIKAWVEGKTLYVELWGTKETDNYVELESKTTSKTPPETVEQVDESLAPGQRKTKSSGHTGYTSEAYKLLYDGSGNLISKTLISKDKYKTENKVVLVGPSAPAPQPEPEPTPDPTPAPSENDPGGGTTEQDPDSTPIGAEG